ncbi:MAG: membrane protein insertase YidC [Ignavibacteriales bacterium]|nr:membrane protein insertase YidC [Ignavibacteriales bacterium]
MDRNTVIAFVLIGLILMVWMYITAPPPKPPQQISQDTTAVQPKHDSVKIPVHEPTDSLTAQDTLGNYFAPLAVGEKKTIFIETELYNAKISTKGGSLKSWELTKFKTWDQLPVNLIDERKGGDFHLLFSTSESKVVNTKNLYFTTTFPHLQKIKLAAEDSVNVEYVLNVTDKSRIIKKLTFYGNKYDVSASYRFEKMEAIISDFEYHVTWETGIKYAEHNSIDESGSAHASIYAGGEVTEIDASNFNEPVKQTVTGQVMWVAARNKYFATAIIPNSNESEGAFIEGARLPMPDKGAKEDYSIGLRMKFLGKEVESSRFTLFLGPLDFDIVKSYNVDLDQMMSLGMAFLIRPISEWFIIPLFQFLKLFIPNYGFVLIVFSIIIKILLHPLSKSSLTSMRKMQALQPMITELREKHKDDPQKMNVQIMRLYSEYGVNPAGGCLPMLLQMPILYALWSVFRSTIELRQAEFIWWIKDLSIPDVIAKLPFQIPIFGITDVSGLAILMGITMFIQQKMTVQDPRQKMMVWMMPVLMTLLFNSFPSGLNLYYFMFNLLSIVQQEWIKRKHGDEPLKKVDPSKKSKGIIARLAKNLPEMKK